MCGICGIVRLDSQQLDLSTLESMTERLRHRGPDDGGVWVSSHDDVQVGMGSRRLSILDLSPRGHMPMSNHDRSLWIVYNGEVYNFQTIRRELERDGFAFHSNTDTEVILHAYEKWGTDCLHKLNGMFAFAIWNERDHSLFVARDRLGVKPLYYSLWGKQFAFASEIKALMEHPEVPRDLDLDALDLYLTFRIIPQPYTIFKSIRKLAPGHYLVFKNGQLAQEEYWDVLNNGPVGNGRIAHNANGAHKHNAVAEKVELRRLLEDAVRLRLISDVPVGLLLSGGIDSTIIATLMARLAGSRIKTFTLGLRNTNGTSAVYDEAFAARRTAKLLGTEHHELLLTPEVTQASIPTVLDQCDEPFGTSSAIPTYLVSKLARENVTVALSGDGADEIFAGYRAYLLESLANVYLQIPRVFRKTLIEPLVFSLHSPDASFTTRSIRRGQRLLRSLDGVPSERFFRLTDKFHDVPPESIYRSEARLRSHDLGKEIFQRYYDEPMLGQDSINRMLYVDSKMKLADHILTKVDLMSMKVSLEVRTPFLDYRVAELAFSLPGNEKLNRLRKKHFLRETFRELLPPHVFRRAKRGFEIPVGNWFKQELREMFLDTVAPPPGGGLLNDESIQQLYREHCRNERDHGDKLWILFALRWWARKNQVSI